MITETLKAKWAAGEATINGWCSIGSSFAAEIMAAQGYDSVSVDVQHGALDYSHALPMLQAMRASGVVPMAREYELFMANSIAERYLSQSWQESVT